MVGNSECVVFEKGVMIGKDDLKGLKKSILGEVTPCETNCLIYPGDPNYEQTMNTFFVFGMFNTGLLNSKTELKNYDQPFSNHRAGSYYSIPTLTVHQK